MLFLTVYGRELESLFYHIHECTEKYGTVSREQLHATFLPHVVTASKGYTKNLEDGISYLKSAQLVAGEDKYSSQLDEFDVTLPFAALLLRKFRQLERLPLQISSINLLYVQMLEQLYIIPNRVWISDVHAAANQLELARQIGGISQEKINAWKRVMEFLGLGYRMGGGFYCLYQPTIMLPIVQKWSVTEGTLQEFFENHLQSWLPCLSLQGEVAFPAANSLDRLAQEGHIRLYSKQDSPSKSYFDTRRLRGIKLV